MAHSFITFISVQHASCRARLAHRKIFIHMKRKWISINCTAIIWSLVFTLRSPSSCLFWVGTWFHEAIPSHIGYFRYTLTCSFSKHPHLPLATIPNRDQLVHLTHFVGTLRQAVTFFSKTSVGNWNESLAGVEAELSRLFHLFIHWGYDGRLTELCSKLVCEHVHEWQCNFSCSTRDSAIAPFPVFHSYMNALFWRDTTSMYYIRDSRRTRPIKDIWKSRWTKRQTHFITWVDSILISGKFVIRIPLHAQDAAVGYDVILSRASGIDARIRITIGVHHLSASVSIHQLRDQIALSLSFVAHFWISTQVVIHTIFVHTTISNFSGVPFFLT